MSEIQHNFGMQCRGEFFYFATQDELDRAIENQQKDAVPVFYQPGIGWVRYTPEPKPKPLSQQLRALALEMERLAGEVRNLNEYRADELYGAANIAKQWANWIKEKHE